MRRRFARLLGPIIMSVVLPLVMSVATTNIPQPLRRNWLLALVLLLPLAILGLLLEPSDRPVGPEDRTVPPGFARRSVPSTVIAAGWFFCLAGCLQLAATLLTSANVDTLAELVGLSAQAATTPQTQAGYELWWLSVLGGIFGLVYFVLGVCYAAGVAVPRAMTVLAGLTELCACCTGPGLSVIVASGLRSETERDELQSRMTSLPHWYEPVIALLTFGTLFALIIALILVWTGRSTRFFHAASTR